MNRIKPQKPRRKNNPENPVNPVNPVSKNWRLVPLLLDWFSRHARDLPWRRTRDPYAIWVSEIMLQQTQVKTVIPYWKRWMRELPTIESVAKASPARLHKLWEGLGYYTRVRNLQRAAQQIVAAGSSRRKEAHSQIRNPKSKTRNPSEPPEVGCYKFPEDFDAILALPGIGHYTAGAICSIAFNQPKPILDGNVIRVLTRVFGITTDPREKKTNEQLWQLAEELVTYTHRRWGERPREPGSRNDVAAREDARPTNACSHFNQSLMELGALVCTPRTPHCDECPLTKLCVARQRGWLERLPKPSKEPKTTARRFIAFVVERDGKFLVRQRPNGVVNAHLWEFPNLEVPGPPSSRRPVSNTVAKRLAEEATAFPGLRLLDPEPIVTIKHSITRYRITTTAWRARLGNSPVKVTDRWLTPGQLRRLAFTSAHKKILQAATAEQVSRRSVRPHLGTD